MPILPHAHRLGHAERVSTSRTSCPYTLSRPRKRWPALLGSTVIGLTFSAAVAWAESPAPPTPVTVAAFTSCQLEVATWVDGHLVALGVIGTFALFGMFSVTNLLMRAIIALGERAVVALERRGTLAQRGGKTQG